MDDILFVIPVGADVVIGDGITGTVLQISISANKHVQLQCAWYEGRNRIVAWLEEHEVKIQTEKQNLKIGFLS